MMINWEEVQKFYDNDNTAADTILEFKISQNKFYKAVKEGLISMRSKSESTKISRRKHYRGHTEETKKKLSEIRKKYLAENPDKVPYLLNHSSRESFPEKYFNEVFTKEGFEFERYIRVGLYELDFSIPSKKIDIEIDGNQHYFDEKIVNSDRKRTDYLEKNGWDVIRINWSDYQKMNSEEKSNFIKDLKNYISDIIQTKPILDIKIEKKKQNYCECGNSKIIKSKKCKDCRIKNKKIKDTEKPKRKTLHSECKTCGSKCSYGIDRCVTCYRKQSRKVDRPTLEVLMSDIDDIGYLGTGKKYGVSDNAIRKWIRNYKSQL